MMLAIINLIKTVFPKFWQYIIKRKRKCIKCKSKQLNDGYWTRGYNNYCQQACGDIGIRCFDCGHIEWNKSCEEYKKTLPRWCVPYCN